MLHNVRIKYKLHLVIGRKKEFQLNKRIYGTFYKTVNLNKKLFLFTKSVRDNIFNRRIDAYVIHVYTHTHTHLL